MTTHTIQAVSTAMNVSPDEINGRALNRRATLARAMVYRVLRDRHAYTGGQISKLLGRDPANVCRALQMVDGLIGVDKGVTNVWADIWQAVN